MQLTPELAELYGMSSAVDGGLLFCGVTAEAFAINGRTYRWPVNNGLTWSLGASRLGVLSDLDLKGMYTDIFAEIAGVVDFQVTYTPNWRAANFLLNTRRLDGPGGVLAQHGIPMPTFTLNDQLVGEYDDSEAWGLYANPPRGKIDAYRVGLHEVLHGCGLGHGKVDQSDPALIEPSYNPNIRHLQRRDKAELLRRYPAAKEAKPVPKPPSSPGDQPFHEARSLIDGEWWEASGKMRKAS